MIPSLLTTSAFIFPPRIGLLCTSPTEVTRGSLSLCFKVIHWYPVWLQKGHLKERKKKDNFCDYKIILRPGGTMHQWQNKFATNHCTKEQQDASRNAGPAPIHPPFVLETPPSSCHVQYLIGILTLQITQHLLLGGLSEALCSRRRSSRGSLLIHTDSCVPLCARLPAWMGTQLLQANMESGATPASSPNIQQMKSYGWLKERGTQPNHWASLPQSAIWGGNPHSYFSVDLFVYFGSMTFEFHEYEPRSVLKLQVLKGTVCMNWDL